MRAEIDAVVVSYNSRETLRACAEPLAALPGVQVSVVDNESSDGSLDSIADLPVRRIASGRNGGFGFGCNTGARAGDAPLLLFINPDARIEADALAAMVSALEADPEVALVGPRLFDDDGTLMRSMRRYQRLGSTWSTALFLHRFVASAWANEIVRDPAAYERPAEPEWLSGACMLVRRGVFEAVGGFDDGFFLYCEDMDLCRRLWAAGHRVRFEPAAVVRHEGGRSAPRASLFAVLARSRMRFARKHYGRLSAAAQHAGLAVHALTHLAAAAGRPSVARGHAAALRSTLRADRRRLLAQAGAARP